MYIYDNVAELSRLTRVGRQSKHNYNCNIQGVSVRSTSRK